MSSQQLCLEGSDDRIAFDGMVGCAFFMFFTGLVFWFLYFRRKPTVPEKKWLLLCVVIAGICGFLTVEPGWITTEEGRQPWIVYNIMRVGSAATPDPMTRSL